MADKSRIEWTDATWNPITGCSPISEGCANCYAKREAEGRLRGKYGYPADDPFRVTFHEDKLEQPLRWKRPRKIFVCSMGDLFHEDVTFKMLDETFDIMNAAENHIFLILTKRPERMREYVNFEPDNILPNVWLGVTAENQQRADERIPVLLQIHAAKRFVSVEPMLGPVNLSEFLPGEKWFLSERLMLSPLDWVICGGETGANARPLHPDWVRSLRDQCQGAQVPFFFKSWGEFVEEDNSPYDTVLPGGCTCFWFTDADGPCLYRIGKKKTGRLLDGRTWDEEPS